MYICLTVDLFKGSNTNLRGVGTFQKSTVNFFNRNNVDFYIQTKSKLILWSIIKQMTNLMPKNKMLKSLQSFLVLKNFSFLISNSLFFQLATVHKNTKISISKNLTSRLPIRDSLFVPFSLTVVTRTNTKTVHKLL